MHDTLAYFGRDPVHRRYHHDQLTFSLVYAFSENFVLPLSHDEVVHGKGSLLAKMPGDPWQRRANLRALYGYMWAHPGKKLLFMGGELGQEREWRSDGSIDWHLLERPEHAGIQEFVRDLNLRYRERARAVGGGLRAGRASAGSRRTTPTRTSSPSPASPPAPGGSWSARATSRRCPVPGIASDFLGTAGGVSSSTPTTSGTAAAASANAEPITAEARPWHDQPYSAEVTLPPLAVLWLVPVA